jgi:hypothetical protein
VLEEHDFIALPFWDDHTSGGPGLIAGVFDAHDRSQWFCKGSILNTRIIEDFFFAYLRVAEFS